MAHRTRHEGDRRSRTAHARKQQGHDASVSGGARQRHAAIGDAAEGPATSGTSSTGHSSQSSAGGTGGDVLQQRGSGYAPGAESRVGSHPHEAGTFAAEGVAAGAAGFRRETAFGRLKPGASGAEEEEQGTDGGAAVTGVSGVSGGGRGTTSTTNTRR
ncbi:MAG TPA: hypothetical protein VGI14_11855 [Casimicrobiaceae bacterium]